MIVKYINKKPLLPKGNKTTFGSINHNVIYSPNCTISFALSGNKINEIYSYLKTQVQKDSIQKLDLVTQQTPVKFSTQTKDSTTMSTLNKEIREDIKDRPDRL